MPATAVPGLANTLILDGRFALTRRWTAVTRPVARVPAAAARAADAPAGAAVDADASAGIASSAPTPVITAADIAASLAVPAPRR